ncbi:hypothetical protein LWI29_025580 [Acer saccharum]|uniref:Uncharacterized protein n=1 Tax=Acer saccharum TaxID=4024 RepID=A0AA39W2D2_ACESA|nr:hypothetical protein LWI29_025580 [Acer saccharum]
MLGIASSLKKNRAALAESPILMNQLSQLLQKLSKSMPSSDVDQSMSTHVSGYGAYPASKAAVETMAKIMAKELKGSGITVNCVAPGPVAVATELFFAGKTEETVNRLVDSCPLGRFGQPDDVRKIVGFLAGDDGEWINGQIIRANGGSVV